MFSVANIVFTNAISGSIAYGNSYFFLFKLAIGGLILLAYFIFIKIKSVVWKAIFGSLIGVAAVFSYNPSLRFQFLSWVLALGVILTARLSSGKKLNIYFVLGLLILSFFSFAGAARYIGNEQISVSEKIDLSLTRLEKAEDMNMLDGFAMVLDVYPRYLDYHWAGNILRFCCVQFPEQFGPTSPWGGMLISWA